MKAIICGFLALVLTTDCVVVRIKGTPAVNRYEMSSERKTFGVFNSFKDI
jgi:hypothetical protein